MPTAPKYYWDACAWIALIQREAGRCDNLKYLTEQAEQGKVEIWTSAFTLAEVFKRPIDGGSVSLDPSKDKNFEDYIEQDFIQTVQVDVEVGTVARRLLRTYPRIRKPQDAVHVATALLNDLDELHTFDRQDLLDLDGVLSRADGQKLRICHPPSAPSPPPATLSLFDDHAMPAIPPARDRAEG